jgi:hypothetical protein
MRLQTFITRRSSSPSCFLRVLPTQLTSRTGHILRSDMNQWTQQTITDDNACFVCYDFVSPFNFSNTISLFLYNLSHSTIAPCHPIIRILKTFGPSKHGTDCGSGPLRVLDRQRQYSRLPPESNRALLCRYSRVSAVSLSPCCAELKDLSTLTLRGGIERMEQAPLLMIIRA